MVQLKSKKSILHETPMRSTIINIITVLVLLPLPIGFINFTNHLDVKVKVEIALSLFNTVLMVKSPLVVAWTFRKYQSNMNTNQDEERERKRKIEVQEAQKRQLEIALRRMENNPIELDVDIVESSAANDAVDPVGKQVTAHIQIEALPEVQC